MQPSGLSSLIKDVATQGNHVEGASTPWGAELLSPVAWAAVAQALHLSPREVEILRGVFNDDTEHAIANELHSSPHTVHTHLGRLHHKLRVRTRTQIVLRVFREYLRLTLSPVGELEPVCRFRAVGRCPLRPAPAPSPDAPFAS